MNKIIHEHLPATALPRALREGIEDSATIRVIVEQEAGGRQLTLTEFRERLAAARQGRPGISTAEAVERVRKLRDEWDER